MKAELLKAVDAILPVLAALRLDSISVLGVGHAYKSVAFSFDTEDEALAVGREFGIELSYASASGSRWLRGVTNIGKIMIHISGPHCAVVEATAVDAAAVDAALAALPGAAP